MKTNIIKTMMLAIALLSVEANAWAIDFGTEATVSTTTTWTFEDFSSDITGHTLVKGSGYLRAYPRPENNNDRQFSFESKSGSVVFDGFRVNYSTVAKASAKMVGLGSSMTTSSTAAVTSGSIALPSFAFNASVAGTIYVAMKSTSTSDGGQRIYFNDGETVSLVKKETATGEIDIFSYTSDKAGVFFIGDVLDTYELYAVRFVPTSMQVSSTTTWTFDDFNATTFSSRSIINLGNGLYARAKGRNMSIATQSDCRSWTFADGYTISTISNCMKLGNLSNGTAGTYKANENSTYMDGTIAFEVTVPGTLYVVMSNTSNNYRINNYDGSSLVQKANATIASTPTEYSVTVDLGTVYIAATAVDAKLYAVRFVPTTIAEVTSWVYIGATGYATFGNNKSLDIPSLPDGLSAYAATASEDGHSVILSSRTGMRRTNGYIVKGTPGTNYALTYNGTTLDSNYNGGDMVRVNADMPNFATTESITKDEVTTTYNRYLLGSDNGVAKFFTPSGSGTLKKGKAYLRTTTKLTAGMNARGISIVFEDETTGIADVRGKVSDVKGDYFDLMGRKVTQLTRGLYIVNGKKVVIK